MRHSNVLLDAETQAAGIGAKIAETNTDSNLC